MFGLGCEAQPIENKSIITSVFIILSDHRNAAYTLVLFGETRDHQGSLKCHNLDLRILLKEGEPGMFDTIGVYSGWLLKYRAII